MYNKYTYNYYYHYYLSNELKGNGHAYLHTNIIGRKTISTARKL